MSGSWTHRTNRGRVLFLMIALLLLAQPARALLAQDAPETIRQVQQALIARGFMEGEADGIYGKDTQSALDRLKVFADYMGKKLDGAALERALVAGEIPCSAVELSQGELSPEVQRLQRRLRTLGYLRAKADGQYGKSTVRAVRVFQNDAALEQTGAASLATQDALYAAACPKAQYPILGMGDKGSAVLALQERLWSQGFFAGELDGQYGEGTRQGVKALETYLMSSGHFDAWDARILQSDLTGVADPLLQKTLFSQDFPQIVAPLTEGGAPQDVYRLQRRLIALGYLSQVPDGGYGKKTAEAVAAFQKRAKLKKSGVANANTLEKLFKANAPEALKPFKLVVDVAKQEVYVYARTGPDAYDKLAYTMACATGPDVVPGSYRLNTGPAKEWLERPAWGGWVRAVYRIEGGLAIYSIPHDAKDGSPLNAYLDQLGKPIKAGGIMVNVENAKLIFEKCPARTPIEITSSHWEE
ncbi:MAG: L,D-transpeptidase family protein [Clostridia bacterium]